MFCRDFTTMKTFRELRFQGDSRLPRSGKRRTKLHQDRHWHAFRLHLIIYSVHILTRPCETSKKSLITATQPHGNVCKLARDSAEKTLHIKLIFMTMIFFISSSRAHYLPRNCVYRELGNVFCSQRSHMSTKTKRKLTNTHLPGWTLHRTGDHQVSAETK